MTITLWFVLVILGVGTFFMGYYVCEDREAAISYIFSILFFMVSGVQSAYLEIMTPTGMEPYHGNAIMGLILIPWAIIAAGLALEELTSESIKQAGV